MAAGSAGGGDKRQGDGIGRWRPTQSRCTTSTSTDWPSSTTFQLLVARLCTCHPRSTTLALSVNVFGSKVPDNFRFQCIFTLATDGRTFEQL